MPDEKRSEAGSHIDRLCQIMAQLRDPEHGCPWDVKQSMSSLTRYTIEEAYEVAEAVARDDMDDIQDELGDLVFQVVFYAQIAKEAGEFCFDDVCRRISDKLVRRHPHVFADGDRQADLSAQWEAIKAGEREAKGRTPQKLLDTVPSGLPALMYAQKLQKRCATVGFDWDKVSDVTAKVKEEVGEIEQELAARQPNPDAVEEEIGDALFAMVNLARHCQVDADTALRKAAQKFARRFNEVEAAAQQSGSTLNSLTLSEMEAFWQQVKVREKQA
ncbi:nucleoside triphosphate pyrophosphohydrolase [Alteromonas halophila]|uniref:Nucleoside triphosphate pyrophosphohydrolase n=1 Tax=Alteromonas halophila TaxID=516698 RepID=A0A918JH88_9ALTE|nr:nucleoside triphosphate pyrophosphohydrolase [Alteromonas halophila]GGW80842.1 nucleoside triphosphate pyrophosphohydrolase [Alteromonas halophila]